MGNTPLHSKRRLSGDLDANCLENTPPHISMDIPNKRPTLSEQEGFPRSAPIGSNFDNRDVDNMAWMLHGASLHEHGSPIKSISILPGPSARPVSFPLPSSSQDLPPGNHTSGDSRVLSSNVGNGGIDLSTDVEMTPTAPQKHLPTVFRWNGGGHEIYVSGTFDNWQKKIPMARRKSGHVVIVDCPPGRHEYKFFIDGAWYHDPTKPMVDNEYGTRNNVVEVKESDFNFLNALEQDIANSKHKADSTGAGSDTESRTPPGEYGRFIPESPRDIYVQRDFAYPHKSHQAPPAPGVGSITQPPLLPPQLLQGILNKDIGVHCDPNLLPPPNHVMVNHLYALSIKDGVVVLSVITRYRQKFVSTLFYKPIDN
ncbi:5'-AMP-activated protein kinase subunit beta-1 [Echinococcus granulosus]|uniref:5'-AMP-activated protein kinase subunit beta-1 n=1 Tax=Echinococcus granulosus TaxID=6210 RepID=U6JA05_ECHGR|nr:5'-AMP-activated protein kinase subunit beta-1 [Echinococcus granulosus]EUB61220.1 5'-AMP-activated protein kinase subunit beta-1 [Echinococcus granulosus]CDS20899.1 5' AMP activated protein kinase subunit beta 1 [Echinococcus granulosus]